MKVVHSILYMTESVENTAPKPAAAQRYFPVWVFDGHEYYPALFTQGQIAKACQRAASNPEDMPARKKSWFERLFG